MTVDPGHRRREEEGNDGLGPVLVIDFIGRSQFVFTIGCEASWGGVTRPSQGWCAGLPTRSVPYDVAVRKQQSEGSPHARRPLARRHHSGSEMASIYRSVYYQPKVQVKSPSPRSTMGAAFHPSSSDCSSCRSLGGTSTKTASGCSWGLVAWACFDFTLAKARRDTTSLSGGRECRCAGQPSDVSNCPLPLLASSKSKSGRGHGPGRQGLLLSQGSALSGCTLSISGISGNFWDLRDGWPCRCRHKS